MRLLLRVLPAAWLVSCGLGDRAPTYADLCRSEIAVPRVPPDTAARMRALERAVADSLTPRLARDPVPMNVYQLVGLVTAWGDQRADDSVSATDMLTALVLAEMRGLMDPWHYPQVMYHLGQQRGEGGNRVWSLLGVPPAECVLENCSLVLIHTASNISPQLRRAAFCRLVTLYTDSTWPTPRQDAEARASERSGVVSTGYRMLQSLADTRSRSDAEFVRKAVRAASASGDLGREIVVGGRPRDDERRW